MNNKENTTISLEILLLNDLLRIHAIDKDIYEKAVQKIESLKVAKSTNQPMVATTT